jgi:hypothetical protein
LGNQARALRAIWRLMVDAGMFSLFPGGVKLRGARTGTNEIAPSPGEWVDIDAPASSDIRNVLMPLPYKTLDAVYIQLAQLIEEGAQRLGGAVTIETGEGRTNVPVGSIMAMIEQTTQIMAAVHKRNHRAQRKELRLLRELFAENPDDLILLARTPDRSWLVSAEIKDLNLVPASDPNIPAQVHRIMQSWALMTIAGMNPGMYDMHAVNDRVLRTIRVSNPEVLLVQPAAPGQAPATPPDPKVIAAQTNMARVQVQSESKQREAALKQQSNLLDHNAKVAEAAASAAADQQDRQLDAQTAALESGDRAADRASREKVAQMREETERLRLEAEEVMHPANVGAIGKTPFDVPV